MSSIMNSNLAPFVFYSCNSGIPITKIMVIRKNSFLANQMAFMSSMNIPINEEYDDLSTLYWIPKLHRNPYREKAIFIISL
jgi:hypothetical protein